MLRPAVIATSPVSYNYTAKQTFQIALERVRKTFDLRVYAYVVMLELVHLLISAPGLGPLADAIKILKQGVAPRLIFEAKLDSGGRNE